MTSGGNSTRARLPPATCNLCSSVAGDGIATQWDETVIAADTLIDLSHFRQLQLGVQLGLSDEDDLQVPLARRRSARMRFLISGSDMFCASSMITTTNARAGE